MAKSRGVAFIVLAMSLSLLLAGCGHYPVSLAKYRENPNILDEGEKVIIRTSDAPARKGEVLQRSRETIVLRNADGDETIPVDRIVSMEVRRFAPVKTLLIGVGIAAGVAVIALLIVGISREAEAF